MADATAERVAEVMVTDKPNTVDDAVVPKSPVSPNTKKNTAVAGLCGMVLVMAILLLNYLLDDRIKTEEDVQKYLELTTLASIPIAKEDRASKSKSQSTKTGKRKKEA
jgi:capsular polysaccharide biosynthesis protein